MENKKDKAQGLIIDEERWRARLLSIGKAQSRYLWALFVLGIFFLSLEVNVGSSSLVIPGVGVVLEPHIILGAAPSIIFILIIVIHGSLRAYASAAHELRLDTGSKHLPDPYLVKRAEAYDTVPNALDLAVFSPKRFEGLPETLLLLNYPVYLSVFIVEAGYLWIRLVLNVNAFWGWPLLIWFFFVLTSMALGFVAFIQVLILWYRRIARIVEVEKAS